MFIIINVALSSTRFCVYSSLFSLFASFFILCNNNTQRHRHQQNTQRKQERGGEAMVDTTFTTTSSSSFFSFFNTNTNKSSSASIDFLFPTGKIQSGTHLCFLSMMRTILSVLTVLVVLLKLKQMWSVFLLKRGGITTVIVRKRRRLSGWVLSAQTEKKVHLLDRIE